MSASNTCLLKGNEGGKATAPVSLGNVDGFVDNEEELIKLSKYELLIASLSAILGTILFIVVTLAPIGSIYPASSRNIIEIFLIFSILSSFISSLLGFTLYGFLIYIKPSQINKFKHKFGSFINIPSIMFILTNGLIIFTTFVWLTTGWPKSNGFFLVIMYSTIIIFIISYLGLIIKFRNNFK